jgi:hypothetical protein
MISLALRYYDKFAPDDGTIKAHQAVIDKYGFVWYGKFGSMPAENVMKNIMSLDDPKILLIHSGKPDRYWAHIIEYSRCMPAIEYLPDYYDILLDRINFWFKVTSFENAPSNVVGCCKVISSGASLSEASRHSMSPYFIIDYDEKNVNKGSMMVKQ